MHARAAVAAVVQARSRKLFLRWALLNSLSVVVFAALGSAYAGRSHGIPLFIAAVTVVLAAVASGYAGVIAWQAGDLPTLSVRPNHRGARARKLEHEAEHLFFATALCQLLGLIGAAIGFYVISTAGGGDDASAAVHQIIGGLGAGLLATVTGVLCSVVLAVEHHLLTHALAKVK